MAQRVGEGVPVSILQDKEVGARRNECSKAWRFSDGSRAPIQAWTGDVHMFISSANAATAAGNFADAQQNLDKAARLLHKSGAKNAGIDHAYGRLYDQMAGHTRDAAAKLKLLQQAQDAYRKFARTAQGPLVQRVNDRLTEIADELKELGTP